jgi:hypothetical protein
MAIWQKRSRSCVEWQEFRDFIGCPFLLQMTGTPVRQTARTCVSINDHNGKPRVLESLSIMMEGEKIASFRSVMAKTFSANLPLLDSSSFWEFQETRLVVTRVGKKTFTLRSFDMKISLSRGRSKFPPQSVLIHLLVVLFFLSPIMCTITQRY